MENFIFGAVTFLTQPTLIFSSSTMAGPEYCVKSV